MKRLKKRIAMLAYKILVAYCKSYLKAGTCEGCIFDDNRPKCCCIANIPTEWYEPNS